MTNHIHFLVTPTTTTGVSFFIQCIGRRYVPHINHKYGRSGSLCEGRYKSSLVQEERYFLKVMKYIELNPVRACMVELPSHYRWSSFCQNAGIKKISLLDFHNIYQALGPNPKKRTPAYIEFFRYDLSSFDM